MKIAVIGTGYVGLVQGTCLAESGNDVVCIDKVAAKIEGLKHGKVPIYEPGLGELVHRNLRDGRLAFTTDLAEGIAEAEIVFIAVGTPQGDDGGADLSGVWAVGRQIAEAPAIAQDHRHQEHRPGRHQRRAGPADGRGDRRPVRRGQQPRVPQGRGGDRRLQQARPRRGRRPPRPRSPSGCTSCTPRSCAPTGRSWSCRPRAPR